MRPDRPILLGIVGDSGTGKTTFSQGIKEVLGPERVTTISTDDYRRYNRIQLKRKKISTLHPDCNCIDIMESHLYSLRHREPILKPVYKHATGDFGPPQYVQPGEFIIVEGLLVYYSHKLRDAFDVKIYLDPQEELRVDWEIKRNRLRGYNREQVIESFKRNDDLSKRFIRPQRDYADIVASFYRPEKLKGETGTRLNLKIILRPSTTIRHPDFSCFINSGWAKDLCCISATLGRDRRMPVDILKIRGNIPSKTVKRVMKLICDELPSIKMPQTYIGRYQERKKTKISDPLAIAQLLTSYYLINMKLFYNR